MFNTALLTPRNLAVVLLFSFAAVVLYRRFLKGHIEKTPVGGANAGTDDSGAY